MNVSGSYFNYLKSNMLKIYNNIDNIQDLNTSLMQCYKTFFLFLSGKAKEPRMLVPNNSIMMAGSHLTDILA
jgi:hypothetical protein